MHHHGLSQVGCSLSEHDAVAHACLHDDNHNLKTICFISAAREVQQSVQMLP